MKTLKSTIFSNNTALSSNIVSLDIVKKIGKIPYAQVVITEGGKKNKGIVDLSDAACFKPGKELNISLDAGTSKVTFKGIVLKHSVKKTSKRAFLTVDIKDKAHKLTQLRGSAVFNDLDDKQIITDLAGKAQVSVDCKSKTLMHKQLVQYYCTDWDFILSRAEANGLLVCTENGKIELKDPQAAVGVKKLDNISEFEVEADMSGQYEKVESYCWDIKNVKNAKMVNTNVISLSGSHNFSDLSQVMNSKTCAQVSGIAGSTEELQAWANAGMVKNRHSMIRGRITVRGYSEVGLGDAVTFSGAGKIFSSTAIVSGIRHRFTSEGWMTDIQCGLSGKWFYKNDDIVEKPASGLIPGINGLQTGIVEAFPAEGDPDASYRIKIKIPSVHETESVIWARLLLPYAGDKRGLFWVPEKGDEVVVGFFNDDPRHAVVLGAVYNGKTKPPLDFTDKNNQKGFVSRSGIKMIFTDEDGKEKVELSTPGGNKLFLEDEKGISAQDVNENSIKLHDKGIKIQDKNQNSVTADDKGMILKDTNKNSLTLNNKGIEIKDAAGNTIGLTSSGIEIKDASGGKVTLQKSGITIESAAEVIIKGTAVSIN